MHVKCATPNAPFPFSPILARVRVDSRSTSGRASGGAGASHCAVVAAAPPNLAPASPGSEAEPSPILSPGARHRWKGKQVPADAGQRAWTAVSRPLVSLSTLRGLPHDFRSALLTGVVSAARGQRASRRIWVESAGWLWSGDALVVGRSRGGACGRPPWPDLCRNRVSGASGLGLCCGVWHCGPPRSPGAPCGGRHTSSPGAGARGRRVP